MLLLRSLVTIFVPAVVLLAVEQFLPRFLISNSLRWQMLHLLGGKQLK